jgi:hypothetical protein
MAVQDAQVPFDQYEFQEVAFVEPDADLRVYHGLTPRTPRDVIYIPVQKPKDCTIYDDATATWASDSIVLRSNLAPATVLLLLATKKVA